MGRGPPLNSPHCKGNKKTLDKIELTRATCGVGPGSHSSELFTQPWSGWWGYQFVGGGVRQEGCQDNAPGGGGCS